MRIPWLTSQFKIVALGICALVLACPSQAKICKWVDENGVTHYAEKCPEQVDSAEVNIHAPPSDKQVEDARQRSQALLQQRSIRQAQATRPARFHSLPLELLGPLPDNTTSVYLKTTGADLTYDSENFGQFFLSLEARENLPNGAYLEAHFPNPANPNRKNVVDEHLRKEGATIRMLSPKSDGFKCWNYEVEVFVYRDKTKGELLDTHHQTIQSRVDLSLLNNVIELTTALAKIGGKCPSAHRREMEGMSVEQLEALCEREREKRLKPEREAHIKRCIDRGAKDPEWCERYFHDWGEPMRLDIQSVRPALYYDLPECIAAKKARQKANGA
jgi:hypothetical protein